MTIFRASAQQHQAHPLHTTYQTALRQSVLVVYLFSTGTVRPMRAGGEAGPGPGPGGAPLLVLVLVLLLPVSVNQSISQTVLLLHEACIH